MMNKRELLVVGFVIMVVIIRLLPHPPNFTPIMSTTLFGGTTFKNEVVRYLFTPYGNGII